MIFSLTETTELKWEDKIVKGWLLYEPKSRDQFTGEKSDSKIRIAVYICFASFQGINEFVNSWWWKTNAKVWTGKGNRGGLTVTHLEITVQGGSEAAEHRQHPIPSERIMGLKSVIQTWVKNGFVELCMSPFTTCLLPVQKADGTYQLVKDLRKINETVVKWCTMLPNPST